MTTKLQWAERDRLHADGLRSCFTCKKIFPESSFYKLKSGSYGLAGMCKECSLEKSRVAYRKKNPDVKPCNRIDPDRDRKICGKCKEDVEIAGFGSCKGTADGHDNICRPCRAATNLKWRWDNIDKARIRERKKQQGPISDREKRYKAYYRAKYPNRIKANSAVLCALKKGILKKQPCEECGSSHLKAHAHHDDYNRPLDVRWLCSIHHREWHMNNEVID